MAIKKPKPVEFKYLGDKYIAERGMGESLSRPTWFISKLSEDGNVTLGKLQGGIEPPSIHELIAFVSGYLQGQFDGERELQEKFCELMGVKRNN